MTMSPDVALRASRLAMVGLIAAGVVAVGAPLIPLDDSIPTPRPADPSQFAPQPRADDEDSGLQASRWLELEPLMHAIHTVEIAQVDAQDDSAPSSDTQQFDVAPVPPAFSGWRYVGSVQVGQTMYAVMSINGKQHYLAQGDSYQNVSIQALTAQSVTASVGDTTHTITRAAPPPAPLRTTQPGSLQGNRLRENPQVDPNPGVPGRAQRQSGATR